MRFKQMLKYFTEMSVVLSLIVTITACSNDSKDRVIEFIREEGSSYMSLAEPMLLAENQEESQILLDFLAVNFNKSETMSEPLDDTVKTTLSLCEEQFVDDAVNSLIEDSAAEDKGKLKQGYTVVKHMARHKNNNTSEAILRTVIDIVKDYKGWDLQYRVLSEEEFYQELDTYKHTATDQDELDRRELLLDDLKSKLEKAFLK